MTALLYLLAFLGGAAAAFAAMLILRSRKIKAKADGSIEDAFVTILRY